MYSSLYSRKPLKPIINVLTRFIVFIFPLVHLDVVKSEIRGTFALVSKRHIANKEVLGCAYIVLLEDVSLRGIR